MECGCVPRFPLMGFELSTTTPYPDVCWGCGSVGNNQKASVFHLKSLRVPSGNSPQLTKNRTYRVSNKKTDQSARAGDADPNHLTYACF